MAKTKHMQSFIWYCLVILISLTTVLPFIWSLSTSFKSDSEILSGSMQIIPSHFTWDHYKEVFETMPFLNYLKNSLILALGGVATNLFFGSLAGYSFGQLKFKGKKPIFLVFLASMMVPSIVTMIPTFIVLRGFPLAGGNDLTGTGGLGLINSYWAILLPGAAGAFSIFFMKQFFEQLPKELGESARIDGASEFKIFWNVYFPLAKPALTTLGIMTFQAGWNAFMWPMIVLNADEMKTVQVGLAAFQYNYNTNYGPLMAGTILATLPVLVLFIFAQRNYVQGMADAGIK
ncbi:carbohydrate ABC transporter permease [Enterococcus gallinarum]|uniref:Carbohydrate ABC transporter permease n=1 Tax=Enterococcus gallinarum TaxID=1353 RepID=A0ABD4HJ01_ENTGA|nr:carbohydrate ABC transporter permease [Enterococcus gallinarum]MBA0947127.1 carbohydrate ABC transporter permease [Enterococcus gallinarum]MBA0960281.1 carbohydrate ABC transporter permease [Enterococcus gallinarum]MBA0968222.1 carbohydrate ABC transporter permease [Enterococcus gallinarum]MBA0971452.1 carbohydrate ABC transporter permease [Enterococcus gallinarum]MCR1930130.1 carbohydrate ABC transporter permease [Enterococcus gallinarum]